MRACGSKKVQYKLIHSHIHEKGLFLIVETYRYPSEVTLDFLRFVKIWSSDSGFVNSRVLRNLLACQHESKPEFQSDTGFRIFAKTASCEFEEIH